jgi:sulfotransferase family protein
MNATRASRELRRIARTARARWQARQARRLIVPGALLPAHGAGEGADPFRLVPAPVFLLSSIRSGSTLMRVVLNSHSQICAPHELHLRQVSVELPTPNAVAGMKEAGLSPRDLENLLWDRVLHLELLKSGKSVIVDKTPQNIFEWQRLLLVWPQARYILLLRHPVRIFESMRRAWPEDDLAGHYTLTTRYARLLAEARDQLPNITVRYEDFVAEPVRTTQDVCAYLGVPWEEGMLRYADREHGRFRGRLGDWSPTLRSGVIRPPQPPPEVVPDELQEACRLLGYA